MVLTSTFVAKVFGDANEIATAVLIGKGIVL
jgi:hypothetical protein